MMRMIWMALLMLPLAGAAAAKPSLGQKIVDDGSSGGAPPCSACHGLRLQGNAGTMAPAIAGKPAAFIVARLHHYASPAGHNPLMKQVARALTPAEEQAVARYIASLPGVPAAKR